MVCKKWRKVYGEEIKTLRFTVDIVIYSESGEELEDISNDMGLILK